MQQVSVAEAAANLAEWIQVVLKGEEVAIVQDGHPLVKLSPIQPIRPNRQPGSAKGLVSMSDDFDEPLEDFQEYME